MLGSKSTHAWRKADDDLLMELARRGVSKARIAIQLHRTQTSIKRRAAALGVKIKSVADIRKSYRG